VIPKCDFDEFYRDAYARLVGQVFVLTGDLGAAQDAVQEAFVRAWSRWDRVSGYDAPEAWVRRVAMNVSVSRWRRLRRAVVTDRAGDDTVVLPDASVEVVELLRDLPVPQRRAVVLHHVVGLSVNEVAAELGVPAGTVMSWLSRGRARLSSSLDPVEVQP
jgi:RNA polymerase sigma-70 factor (ECF subfamily)